MSFTAALKLLKRDVIKLPSELPTFHLLRDQLSVTPLSDRDPIYTFIDKEVFKTSTRKLHRLYVLVPNCDTKCVGWVLNCDVDACMICSRSFNSFPSFLFKHHCRCCGNIVCSHCVADQEIIIFELSDLGGQLVCTQCYFGQDEVHALCYIVNHKTGLDKNYVPPKVKRMLTGEALSRRPTGEMYVGISNRRPTGEFGSNPNLRNPSPAVPSQGEYGIRHNVTPARTSPISTVASRDNLNAIPSSTVTATAAATSAFIIKTKILKNDLTLAATSDQTALQVYIHVMMHDQVPMFTKDGNESMEYTPYVVCCYREYLVKPSSRAGGPSSTKAHRSGINNRSNRVFIFNIIVHPDHILPLVNRPHPISEHLSNIMVGGVSDSESSCDEAGGKLRQWKAECGTEMLSRYQVSTACCSYCWDV